MKLRTCLGAVASLLAAVLLCGCTLTGTGNVDELLRAPQLSGEYSAVQKALNSYLGESAQLKYPQNGDFLSPFLFGDWDGDGVQDAAVLYLDSQSANVQLAVLQTDDQGKWEVSGTAEGLSDTVDSVRFARMQGGDANQILVGYATQGAEYLAVYSYKNHALQAVLQQTYSQYLIEDITGSGTEDIVLLTSDEKGQTQIRILTDGDDGFAVMQVIGLSADRFTGYAALAAGVGANGGQYLVLDGWTGASGSYLASVILAFDKATGQMSAAQLPGTNDIYTDSLRYASVLTSRDIDGDGIVEIPVQTEEAGNLNLVQNRQMSFVRWMDYTSAVPEKHFGLLDEEYGYYLELPMEWEGNLLMTDGPDADTVVLNNLSGGELYLELRVVSAGELSDGWQSLATVDSRQVQVHLGETTESTMAARFAGAVHLLK